ncbi:MAG: ATP-dependent sacrificial sulfur transferase LarE [Planctomycetota bacterium]
MSTPSGAADSYADRRARLFEALDALPAVAVAFSGGVDSSVLLHAAHARLGARAIGVIADSASLPRAELEAASDIARAIGVELVVLETEELSDPRYQENAGDRCYFCKHALFTGLDELCRARQIAFQAFGEIADDLALLRHGSRAAREFGVLAPLSQAGFTKADVRRYAAENQIASADKPASACLASRVPTGTRVTRERLARIERAEAGLRELGFRVLRVRDHAPLARVEVGETELARARELESEITVRLFELGFERVELAAYGVR